MTIQFDENGIIIQNLSEILDEREAYARTFLGDDFVISGESVVANIESADADRELAIQELLLYIATQLDPDQAEGIWLDYICALNNITRISATKTNIPITITGTPGTNKNSGEITIADESTDEYLINQTAFIIGEDGTANVQFEATSFGPLTFLSSSNYYIKTPSIGLSSVIYNTEGVQNIGRNTETDEELRARRKESVEVTATSVLSSIKANVLQVTDVIQVKPKENDDLIEVDGIPPKSFEIVVRGGDDQAIAEAIFYKKPAGIKAFGTTNVEVSDEDGNKYTIGFTRPIPTPITVSITLNLSSAQTESWIEGVKSDIVSEFTKTYNIGDDVYASKLYCQLAQYEQVVDIPSVEVALVPEGEEDPDWGTSVAIADRELATLDVSNVIIQTSVV